MQKLTKWCSDAEQHAADDLKRKEDVEARNMADSSVYAAEKFLADNAESIPDAQKTAVQAQIDVVKSAMEGGDTAAMKESAGQLQNVLQEAGAAMYQQQGGPVPVLRLVVSPVVTLIMLVVLVPQVAPMTM